MKKLIKVVLLLLPFIILVLVIAFNSHKNSQVYSRMQDADGLIMGTAENRYVVRANRSVENEVTTDVIVVTDHDGKVVQDISVSMDHDMFGLGFVKAMQADSDPELEVVAWGNNVRQGETFFLDFADGKIMKRPVDEISGAAKQLIEDYKNANSQSFSLFFYFIVLTPLYYILYFIVRLVMKPSAKKEAGNVQD